VNDVAEAFARFVNDQSAAAAGGEEVSFPMADGEGGKEALLAQIASFTMGSDHHVWTEGSFRVPAVYMNDWPDRYIHTDKDTVANIDPTKLKRAAFIGAATALYLADLGPEEIPDLWDVIRGHAMERWAGATRRARIAEAEGAGEGGNVLRFQAGYEREILASISRFAPVPEPVRARASAFLDTLARSAGASGAYLTPELGKGAKIYERKGEPKGPMSGFGYDYFEDHTKAQGIAKPELLSHDGPWGGGGEYAYEALNLVDGKRSVARIRDDLSAIYGPIPLDQVASYLDALHRIGILASK